MLGSRDIKVTSGKFLELSKSPDTCTTLRRSGCIPLFVQMIHSDSDEVSRKNAAQALHNVVHCHPDDKVGRRESKVLKLIETVMAYCEFLKRDQQKALGIGVATSPEDPELPPVNASGSTSNDRHPSQAIFSLMKISFDEEHRHAMCQLGALQAIAHLVHLDHAVHGMQPKDSRCVSLRRYAGMALTNLTFGDGNNKALLCSNKEFMRALVAQLNSLADDLIQVTASVLRNLSWRADNNMITVLNEIGTVTALTYAAMKNNNMENTLKAILSALWNLSAHCSANKAEFCRVVGALAFLVEMLTYDAPSKTLTIVENAGGILRNVSSHIAVREDYRQILRERDCLGILLQQLRSESLTIVSNACGTLWNLSARCATDQKYLWENGAVPMLRSLIHSKHKMISNGSNAALKNLLNYRPGSINHVPLDSVTKAMNLKELPSLQIRKQRALEQELDRKLADTCEIIDMAMSPKKEKEQQQQERGTRIQGSRGASVDEEDDTVEDEEEDGEAEQQSKEDEKGKVESGKSEGQLEHDQKESQEENEPVSMNVAPPASMGERPQQETDFDQITDYSLRYEQEEEECEEADDQFNGNEIILILEDTVKCYEEEGTPYTISNATSMTDLRRESNERRVRVMDPQKAQLQSQQNVPRKSLTQQAMNSGLQTPEKPFQYEEEGTPGCFSTEFSRIGSLSSLEGDSPQKEGGTGNGETPRPVNGEKEVPLNNQEREEKRAPITEPEPSEQSAHQESNSELPDLTQTSNDVNKPETIPTAVNGQTPPKVTSGTTTPPIPATRSGPPVTKASPGPSTTDPLGPSIPTSASKSVSFIDYAQETPLMFSRTSSLESLSSAEPACVDDVSSVVSEFSRVASGIMSPSELPDSPTQSVPQSPSRRRRLQPQGQIPVVPNTRGPSERENGDMMPKGVRGPGVGQSAQPSVFEDKMDMFDVENTPAQFSCATSLSNLSFLNDDQGAKEDEHSRGALADGESNPSTASTKVPNGGKSKPLPGIPDNGSDSDADDDGDEANDELLDTCVNMGLNRRAKGELNPDFMRHYYTEDTPAHLSKAASNSDLSVLSMLDNANQCEVVHDDSSSSAGGGGSEDDEKLLQECIANGIENTISKAAALATNAPVTASPRVVERPKPVVLDNVHRAPRRDSLSSLSIDSGDDGDNNLDILEQAIAAGMNRVQRKPEFIVGGPTTKPAPLAARLPATTAANDSLSSLDSCESNEQSNLLFEQCIQSGIEKRSGSAAGSTTTLIPTTANPPAPMRPQKPRAIPRASVSSHNSQRPRVAPRHVEYHKTDDEALLNECISMGIEKNVTKASQPQPGNTSMRQIPQPVSRYDSSHRENINSENILARQNQDIMRRIERMTLEEKFGGEVVTGRTVSSSKNVNGASVDTWESFAGAVPGILPTQQDTREQQSHVEGSSSTDAPRNGQREEQEQQYQATTPESMALVGEQQVSVDKGGIINSINGFDDGHALEQSNEYPALKSSAGQSLMASDRMNASNEYMVDSVNRRAVLSMSEGSGSNNNNNNTANNKHKDPDLMLKSVDRLTHVLVSTGEYLRAHKEVCTEEAKQRMEGSCDEGTWNDNTCPNGDVSFPSVSYSPPKIDGEKVEDHEEEENTITASVSLNKITQPRATAIDATMRGTVTETENGLATNWQAVETDASKSLSVQQLGDRKLSQVRKLMVHGSIVVWISCWNCYW